MSVLWPDKFDINPSPSFLGRLGRLLHWACAIVALLFGGLGLMAMLNGVGDPMVKVMFLGLAAIIWFAGRGVRYVLAGE